MTGSGLAYDPAPFLIDHPEGLPDRAAHWAYAEDGLRLRLSVLARGGRGTVLIFPGRTEYIEKYVEVAARFAAADLSVVAVDWRGQGLAERMTRNRLYGHVDRFDDYQRDVATLVAYARDLDLPKPWYLLAHSMGGAIGLRAVNNGLPVAACAFSAPMWDLTLSPAARFVAQTLGPVANALGLAKSKIPGTQTTPYVLTADRADNVLTTDPERFDWFRAHVATHPDLGLGGPTFGWLHQSMREFLRIAQSPAPKLPTRIHLGTAERIVCPATIRRYAAAWSTASLVEHDGAEHEVMMERPAIRHAVIDDLIGFFTGV